MNDLDLQPYSIEAVAFVRNVKPEEITFECHKDHGPRVEVAHHHHVFVQAWQQHFAPLGAVRNSDGIWMGKTVLLPPSCHYAVHGRLVALMRLFGALRLSFPELSQSELLERTVEERPHGHGNLAEIAERSPRGWIAAGLSVDDLFRARLWGQL